MNLLVSLLAFAQDAVPTTAQLFDFGFKQGLAAIGGGFGIARLAAAAMEGISRQPEAAGDIRGGMILAAALIEGVTLLALITCILSILF